MKLDRAFSPYSVIANKKNKKRQVRAVSAFFDVIWSTLSLTRMRFKESLSFVELNNEVTKLYNLIHRQARELFGVILHAAHEYDNHGINTLPLVVLRIP